MKHDQPFCFLYQKDKLTCIEGEIKYFSSLAEIPRGGENDGIKSISMIPFCQMKEKNFAVRDDGEKIITLVPHKVEVVDVNDALNYDDHIELSGHLRFNVSDEEFIKIVESVIENEIKKGEGSNFLLSRKCFGNIKNFSQSTALTILHRFIDNEFGAYCNFCFYDGQRYFIGSSPEIHLSMSNSVVQMNPICGTLPKSRLHSNEDLVEFLTDPKEINELFQVVDETLKLMCKICYEGGEVHGPYLKEMRTLIHTEYMLRGTSHMDPIDAFRASMFAPTMVGSPMENAAKIIHKYEKESRRYYSSAILMAGVAEGAEYIDSAITIRTMEVDADGLFCIQSGASIVRDSEPERECYEIKTKAQGLFNAIQSNHRESSLASFFDEEVSSILKSRNETLSHFWIDQQSDLRPSPHLQGKRVLVLDNEDEFTYMLSHLLKRMGLDVEVVRAIDKVAFADYDCVVVGPGPGDPTNLSDARISKIHNAVRTLLNTEQNFMAICLGHQVLCHMLGHQVHRLDPPLQGAQVEVDLYGKKELVGFYNTFVFRDGIEEAFTQSIPPYETSHDEEGTLLSLRSERFVSFQCHLESVLTMHGYDILKSSIEHLFASEAKLSHG